ncbi:arylamine N-acetyltransferase family protein [Allorhizocola rhizosphaerae]|uniref:arylamine N-acetyltransferase family protein n=1 Tax=Allorhizocola rhizosphaerae TaxID=1872709 RepID=UPI001FE7867F|nr:arylamine N-acetyltransferase [Allorhizocola rhizosphaerae]
MTFPADAYLERIGASRDSSLQELQLRHLMSVPFENLSIHLVEPIVLDPVRLAAKIVERRRGGFCYELNGAFAGLLAELGHDVKLMQGRVITPEGLGIPYDHLALRVGPWLVDVGFGSFAHHPLRLDTGDEQKDPAGVFQVVQAPDGDLDVIKDGVPEYRLDLRPRELRDFTAGCWWHTTSPLSHFTRKTVCSLLTADGRITLSGKTLTRTVEGVATKRELAGDDEIRAAYRELFGIVLEPSDLRLLAAVTPA